jgi:hypothetical protein
MTKMNQITQMRRNLIQYTDTRDWSAAVTELACFALARRKGKRLVKIINTKKSSMPIICIFEDYPE